MHKVVYYMESWNEASFGQKGEVINCHVGNLKKKKRSVSQRTQLQKKISSV